MFSVPKSYLFTLFPLLFLLKGENNFKRLKQPRHTILLVTDTDGDGVDDAQDMDDDNDGILDVDEAPVSTAKFQYTGRDVSFTVPQYVTELNIKVWGAGGGGSNYQAEYSSGGAGGYVSGTLSVNPGDQFSIMVGQGGTSDNSASRGSIYGFGGLSTAQYFGSCGGGLSGVFTGTAPITPNSQSRAVLIAGGGGSGERSTVFTSIGGQGGDPVFSGGNGSMQGANDSNAYGGAGGGGYSGGVADQTRMSTDPANVEHGEGGSNYVNPVVGTPNSLASPDLASLSNPYSVQENLPPNTSDSDYTNGIGVGTSVSGYRGGHGLVVISYIQKPDTDLDGTPDYLDLDSDNDGCSDANEAYGDPQADGGDGSIYGTGIPTLANGGVNANGLVIAANINAAGDGYTNTIATVGGAQTFRQGIMVAIDQNPADQTAQNGDVVRFTARASTSLVPTSPPTSITTDVSYIWEVSTDDGASFNMLNTQYGVISSGSPVNLDLSVDPSMDGYRYRVLFISPANTCFSQTQAAVLNIHNQTPSVSLLKSAFFQDENTDGFPQEGETIIYDFTVENTGTTPLTSLSVDDPLLGGQICNFTSLPTGDTATCSFTHTLSQTEIDNGELVNQASVTATYMTTPVSDLSDDPNNPTDFDANSDGEPDDPTVVLLVSNPSISLYKSALFNDENADGFAQPGETIRYTFNIQNTGNTSLFDLVIADELLGGEICKVQELAPGASSVPCTIDYAIKQEDLTDEEVVNQALATGYDLLGNEVSDLSDDPNDPADFDANNDGEPDDPTLTRLLKNIEDLEFFNGITPNNDGVNDYFKIDGIDRYPDNNLKIFNRWGVLVWEADGYGEGNTIFKGISNGRATIGRDKKLPSGTYFYALKIPITGGENERLYTGYIYLNH